MKVVIVGVGTTAMIVADILLESHNFKLAGYVGTKKEEEHLKRSKIYHGVPFLGDHSILKSLKKGDITGFVVAIGDNHIREKVYYEAMQADLIPVNAVSRKAIINSDVELGKGVVVSPGVVLSHGVTIGSNVILDPSAIVHVETTVSDHCYLFAGVVVCGRCYLEKNVTVEAGAVVQTGVKIGKNNRIEAGRVVRKNVAGKYRNKG